MQTYNQEHFLYCGIPQSDGAFTGRASSTGTRHSGLRPTLNYKALFPAHDGNYPFCDRAIGTTTTVLFYRIIFF